MGLITGVDMAKKSLSKTLAKEIELKKKIRLKENGSMGVFGISKQAFYKRLKKQKQQVNHQKMIIMVKDYRKKVGSKTGGIKLYQDFINANLAQRMTDEAVYIYSNLRTHFSLDLRKPVEVHLNPNIKYKSYRKNNVNLPELTI